MKTILTATLLFFIINLNAQKEFIQEKFQPLYFQGLGVEFDYTSFPYYEIESNSGYYANRWESVGLNFSFYARLNVLELESDQALSLSIQPYLGLSFGNNRIFAQPTNIQFSDVFGFGNVGLPIYFNYHIGKNATHQSTANFGLTLSIGREYLLNPIFKWEDTSTSSIPINKYYEVTVLKLGITRERKKLKEFYVLAKIFHDGVSAVNPLSSIYYGNEMSLSIGVIFFKKNNFKIYNLS